MLKAAGSSSQIMAEAPASPERDDFVAFVSGDSRRAGAGAVCQDQKPDRDTGGQLERGSI